jgi:lipocalin
LNASSKSLAAKSEKMMAVAREKGYAGDNLIAGNWYLS